MHGDASTRYGMHFGGMKNASALLRRRGRVAVKVWSMLCASTEPADAFFWACRMHQPKLLLPRAFLVLWKRLGIRVWERIRMVVVVDRD